MGLSLVTLVVDDYDRAVSYFVETLGFSLKDDTPLGDGKRWVVVQPPDDTGAALLLAKAIDDKQIAAIGAQTGGRVAFFLSVADFDNAYTRYRDSGVAFLEAPRNEDYGKVAVFKDLYGNKWDLIEPVNI